MKNKTLVPLNQEQIEFQKFCDSLETLENTDKVCTNCELKGKLKKFDCKNKRDNKETTYFCNGCLNLYGLKLKQYFRVITEYELKELNKKLVEQFVKSGFKEDNDFKILKKEYDVELERLLTFKK